MGIPEMGNKIIGEEQADASKFTVRDLLIQSEGKENQEIYIEYIIPDYQRNYSWERPEIDRLISDILNSFNENQNKSYFLGNIIVNRRKMGNEINYELIDGQQRFTTLFLLVHGTLQGTRYNSRDTVRPPRYQARPLASQILKNLEGSNSEGQLNQPGPHYSIIYGYNLIKQRIEQDPTIKSSDFIKYLLNKVYVVQTQVPQNTDLNKYFEIMNTRGKQLEPHEIIKAKMMSLLDEVDRSTFSRIWDSVSNMPRYLQISFVTDRDKNARKIRESLFGKNWNFLENSSFDDLANSLKSENDNFENQELTARKLDAAINYYRKASNNIYIDNKESNFRSILSFPSFLLYILNLTENNGHPENLRRYSLDDKKLIKRFEEYLPSTAGRDELRKKVKKFSFNLYKGKFLYDQFILRRDYTDSDEGNWSLKRMEAKSKNKSLSASYTGTFGDSDFQKKILMLQSAFRITFTSAESMHWITLILDNIWDLNTKEQIRPGTEKQILNILENHAREQILNQYLRKDKGQIPQGFAIPHIVFSYLDYLLAVKNNKLSFEFTFRNSIEHFSPQNPDVNQEIPDLDEGSLNSLGNLALISISDNSRFNNNSPRAKVENFPRTIEQSIKLQIMAEAVKKYKKWDSDMIQKHAEEMLQILKEDIENNL